LIGIVAGDFRSLRGLTPGYLQKATPVVDLWILKHIYRIRKREENPHALNSVLKYSLSS
jgi:hypothetical protein